MTYLVEKNAVITFKAAVITFHDIVIANHSIVFCKTCKKHTITLYNFAF